MNDHNVNLAQCLVNATHWGFTRVHNVCSGVVHDVPWGAMDYLGVLALIAFGLGFLSLIAFFGYILWSDR